MKKKYRHKEAVGCSVCKRKGQVSTIEKVWAHTERRWCHKESVEIRVGREERRWETRRGGLITSRLIWKREGWVGAIGIIEKYGDIKSRQQSLLVKTVEKIKKKKKEKKKRIT